ncbi:hypothetical protein JOM56_001978 [Amanita muscaria]
MASLESGLEMSLRQRAMVDTCFEEGQYELAISVLEQLRSSTHRPSNSHVRQLIYIALHPISDAQPEKTSKSIYDSPSKLQPFSKTSLSSAAVLAAQQLLFSFAATQTPDSLARALPCYDASYTVTGIANEDMGDSDISRESLCINEARDCWGILAEGFVSKSRVLFSSPKRKSRRRIEDDFGLLDDEGKGNCDIIGESAWPVLDWVLTLFERNEQVTLSKENSLYSPLLLNQIPPTRSSTGARWDIENPLAIVIFCLQQSDFRRQRIGARLMNLLINLSLTPSLDFPMFIASVFGRFSTATSEIFRLLLTLLSPSLPNYLFKVALCYKFINEAELSEKPGVNNSLKIPVRARKPRSKRETDRCQLTAASDRMASTNRNLPTCEAILCALKKKIPPAVDGKLQLRVKFELFVSYGTIQKEASEMEKDVHWTSAIRQISFRDVLSNAFSSVSGEEGTRFGHLAQSMLSTWI